jgi:hypothetical protein
MAPRSLYQPDQLIQAVDTAQPQIENRRHPAMAAGAAKVAAINPERWQQ